ncbi:MAG: hypothetical protein M3468_08210 [Acidobacteriota bacterium]|nr:hypothetical protein [Acidobacteriota bacterium]
MTTDDELRARLALAEEARRAADAALKDSERLAVIGSWTWLPGPDTVTWSEEMFRIAGRDQQLGAPSFAEQSSMYSEPQVLRDAVDEMVRTGETFEVEVELERPDGEQQGGRIDLLLTEMALPALAGQELASRLRSARPDRRVLFIADSSSIKSYERRGEQNAAPVVRKPFTRLELSRRVRDVLDEVDG